MKATIEDIWTNHRNELLSFLLEKGQGIYDELILEESIKEEKEELVDNICRWIRENYSNYSSNELGMENFINDLKENYSYKEE